MTQKRTRELPVGATLLATVVVLLLCFPVSYADSSERSPVGTGATSLNLRGVYYGTVEDQKPLLVGRVGVALVESTGVKQVAIDHAFNSGDKFRFLVSSNHDGFLYILHGSSINNLKQLWPHTKMSDTFEIRSGQTYAVPPSPGVFTFDEEVGKEQFYIAVRSEPEVPRPDVPGQEDNADQTTAPGDSEEPRVEEVEWIIRGVTFDPGAADGDLYRYFSAAPGDHSTKAMVEIMLMHSR